MQNLQGVRKFFSDFHSCWLDPKYSSYGSYWDPKGKGGVHCGYMHVTTSVWCITVAFTQGTESVSQWRHIKAIYITGLLWGEATGHRWLHFQNATYAENWSLSWRYNESLMACIIIRSYFIDITTRVYIYTYIYIYTYMTIRLWLVRYAPSLMEVTMISTACRR